MLLNASQSLEEPTKYNEQKKNRLTDWLAGLFLFYSIPFFRRYGFSLSFTMDQSIGFVVVLFPSSLFFFYFFLSYFVHCDWE